MITFATTVLFPNSLELSLVYTKVKKKKKVIVGFDRLIFVQN